MSIGERIMELRKAAGISQLELSKILEVSRQAVSKWETDQGSPDVMHLIHLAEVLDTDVEYLATGRRSLGRRPPVVIRTTETIERIVEKPVVQVQETIVERIIETPVVQVVEKPVTKKVYRTKYVRNSMELVIVGAACFLLGLLVGILF